MEPSITISAGSALAAGKERWSREIALLRGEVVWQRADSG
jgi:hypothetical protein